MQANSQQPDVISATQPKVPDDDQFRVTEVPIDAGLLVGDTAVFSVGESLCAIQAKCTHRGGPLNEGKLEGATVTCPWHQAQFNVCTGAVLRGPATEPVKTFRVTVQGELGRVEK